MTDKVIEKNEKVTLSRRKIIFGYRTGTEYVLRFANKSYEEIHINKESAMKRFNQASNYKPYNKNILFKQQ
jgi:translation elongation factor P/translation initiation factor 5A